MPILIKMDSSTRDSRWEAMVPATYAREAELQVLLQTASAELIPLDPSLDDRHVVYAREVATSSGPIDLVGIGSSGSVTIMECKLARNQQIKREIVGQVLDYAASLWETDLTALVSGFTRSSGHDPFEALRLKFGSEAAPFDEEQCRGEVSRRLHDGDFRLLVAVDEIDADLRRIIQYVNRRGGPRGGLKLVALAFPRFETGSTQVLVPETYGDELADAPKPPAELSEVQHLHLEYWAAFGDYLDKRRSLIKLNRPSASIASSQVAQSGYAFRAWNRMNDGRSGVEAIPKSPEAMERFRVVERETVDGRLRRVGGVHWSSDPERPSVWAERDGKQLGMPNDRNEWPELMRWMADALDELWSLFGSTV